MGFVNDQPVRAWALLAFSRAAYRAARLWAWLLWPAGAVGICRCARLDLARGVRMTVVEGILLALSVAVFVYLGIAIFKPDWF